MDAFISRKRRRMSPPAVPSRGSTDDAELFFEEEESTDMKLAMLSSLHPGKSQDLLLDVLLNYDGSVADALNALSASDKSPDHGMKRKLVAVGMQTALAFDSGRTQSNRRLASAPLTKKGKTLHLYSPKDIAWNTPCSIIHNFLPTHLANDLLCELLPEVETYESATFKLFENVVKSPHTACFYVDDLAEQETQRNEYLYNGSNLDDVRQILPTMRKVSHLVREAVNKEIAMRISDHYPGGERLKYQTSKEWLPNAAFVNCYNGGTQSVGYHSDQLTYLGPRCVIASISLGVAREFRVRRIVPKDEDDKGEAADASGQIAIHLPHNSMLVMHAEMQEEWKHSISPAQSIDPHPISGNKRINITYRWYRPEFHPTLTPKCKCGVPTVLKTVQRQKQNRGRYMWMCQTSGRPEGGEGCGFFEWAEFTNDGDPIWKHQMKHPAVIQDVPKATSYPTFSDTEDPKV